MENGEYGLIGMGLVTEATKVKWRTEMENIHDCVYTKNSACVN